MRSFLSALIGRRACTPDGSTGGILNRSAEGTLNESLRGYPRNHDYRVKGDLLVPGRELRKRSKLIGPLMPRPLESLLDVGSCKGFFVLSAARENPQGRFVGIDVHEPFISAASAVRDHFKQSNASFHLAGLQEVAEEVGKFGGPFQVVTVLNVYHYLYWGSGLDSTGARSHEVLLERLATVCAQRVIFSTPLEVAECPGEIAEFAARDGGAEKYTAKCFMAAAEKFFTVRQEGYCGRRPLLVLEKRR